MAREGLNAWKSWEKMGFSSFLSTKVIQERILGEVFPSVPVSRGKEGKIIGMLQRIYNSWISTGNSWNSFGVTCAGEGEQIPKNDGKRGGKSQWEKNPGKCHGNGCR